MTSVTAATRRVPLGITGVALILLLLVSLDVWRRHAPLYFPISNPAVARHEAHISGLWLHIVTATLPLLLGPALLWSGLRNRMRNAHRWAGRLYLAGGAIGVGAGVWLAVTANHRPTPNFSIGLVALGSAWFAAAFMAFRAIRNFRIESHREWTIRSYILTWSFVVCRLPEYNWLAPVLKTLGPEGDATILWLGWVVPLCVAQIVIDWRRGADQGSSGRNTRSKAFA